MTTSSVVVELPNKHRYSKIKRNGAQTYQLAKDGIVPYWIRYRIHIQIVVGVCDVVDRINLIKNLDESLHSPTTNMRAENRGSGTVLGITNCGL